MMNVLSDVYISSLKNQEYTSSSWGDIETRIWVESDSVKN